MIALETALELVLAQTPELSSERVPLARARGRVLRREVVADLDSPPFDCSAMDGYAVRSPASGEGFRLLGEVAAGDVRVFALRPGECVRVFTGAQVPAAADRVIMQEYAKRTGDVVAFEPHDAPAFIRRRGENCRRGDVVVSHGARLSPIALAALASCGVTEPEVSRPPRVFHIVTGDELIAPEQQPEGTQIRDSNSILVRSFLDFIGADLVTQVRLGDEADPDLPAGMAECDLLLISGGASVGDRDRAKTLLHASGFALQFERVNLRPGKPTVFATRGKQVAFAVPGNPVSHWVVLELLVAPVIRRLLGLPPLPQLFFGTLENEFTCRPDQRQTFWPCRAELRHGSFVLAPLPFVSSGDVMSTAIANALLPVAANQSSFTVNDKVEFLLCDHGR